MAMKYQEMWENAKNEVKKLMETTSSEELEKRFFKDHGCVNFRSDDDMYEIMMAREFHEIHSKLHPELHDPIKVEKFRSYYETTCKCGFKEACDCSD